MQEKNERATYAFFGILGLSRIFGAVILLVTSPILTSAEAPGQEDGPTTFALRPPLVTDVDTNAAYLNAGDFDGDGKMDFLVFDQSKNLLRLFHGRDLESDTPFEKTEMVLEQVVTRISVGDLNGDGRDDVLIGANPPAILYQRPEGGLAAARELEFEADTARVVDINGDGRDDILAVRDRFAIVVLQNADGELERPVQYRSAFSLRSGPDALDIDGDGRKDLVFLHPERRDTLVVRFQDGDGGFGGERVMRVGDFNFINGAARLGNDRPGYVLTDSRTGVLKIVQLEGLLEPSEPILGAPVLCAFDIESPTGRESLRVGRLGDASRPDLILTSPESARLFLFSLAPETDAITKRVAPTMQAVSQAQIAPRDGALWLLSPVEEAVGVMAPEGEGAQRRMTFPTMLGFGFKPMAFAVGDLGGADEAADMVVGYRPTDSADRNLRLAFYLDVEPGVGRLDTPTTMTLPNTESAELTALQVADVNNDGADDLICFFDFLQPRILLQTDSGQFETLDIADSAGAGLLTGITPGRLRVTDADGDGLRDLLICRSSFARLLNIDRDGAVTVKNQFNGRDARSDIASAVAARLEGGDAIHIVLLDVGNQCLTIYGRDEAGDYDILRNVALDSITPRELLAADLNGDGCDDLILVANDRLALILAGGRDETLKMVASSIPDIEEGRYGSVRSFDLTDDGFDEIVVLETQDHLLDFLSLTPAGDLERFYRFQVFEGPERSAMGQMTMMNEPRELVFVDFNGDGQTDVLALCHREALVYLRQKR